MIDFDPNLSDSIFLSFFSSITTRAIDVKFHVEPEPPKQAGPGESVKTRNAVYCAIVMEEFVKELAALSQEHSVLNMDDDGYSSC